MVYSIILVMDCVISVDKTGVLEYWHPGTLNIPENVTFEFKSTTDLYEFAKVVHLATIMYLLWSA